ncbi:MAG: amidase [Gammaproteobacteria bacterium]|nr:amidase [Gammaproteobacteria bacterium]
MSHPAFLSANELARKIRDREISSLELTDHYIKRIEQLDGSINAVVVRDFDRALAAAAKADKELARGNIAGPLHGVPVTVKEAFNIAGLATNWGVPGLRDNIADADAEAVRRLRQSGAVFMGKTNVPFGLGDVQTYNDIYGVTNNPWELSCTPGGSSGGSAAALAAGLCALEVGSDMAGSIRVPAHFCGLYGHKPTWGVVPNQGHALPGAVASPDLGVVGPMARSIEDLVLAMDLLAGAQPLNQPGWRLSLPRPDKNSLREYKVAVLPGNEIAPVDDEIAARVADTGEILAEHGAKVSDQALPDIDFKGSHEIFLNLMWSLTTEGVTEEQYLKARQLADSIPPEDSSDAAISARARVSSHRGWLHNNNQREFLRYAWRKFFDEWDILICPVFAVTAFNHDHSPINQRTLTVNGVPQAYLQPMFWSGMSTVSYLPGTVFPAGLGRNGLPIGLQVISAEYNDYITLDFVRLLSRHTGGFQIPPDAKPER